MKGAGAIGFNGRVGLLMARACQMLLRSCAPAGLTLLTGCTLPLVSPATEVALLPHTAAPPSMVRSAADTESAPAPGPQDASPFAGQSELSVEAVVQEVLARNPSLAQMIAAWQAVSARPAQVSSLDDPMFEGTIGPASIGSKEVDTAYRLELSQRYPFPGKRALRGQGALAEAGAAGRDVEDQRLQLIESARSACYDYYLAERALAVNRQNLDLLQDLRKNAEARFKANQATEQDYLQADVEIGRQRERLLLLERLRRVAIARLNTLMHRPPDFPLPPAPLELKPSAALPAVQELRAVALARRPDLQALADRMAAEQAAVELARREYYPDFELLAAYDAFWQPRERDLRPMVGVKMNLPVRAARRRAAVAEAEARLAQRRAEYDRLVDQINFEVQQAYEQLCESEQSVRLYEQTLLPAARQNVAAAQRQYTAGKVPFLSLVEAQRNLVSLRERQYEVIAEYFRRRATLERVIGGPAPAVGVPATEVRGQE